MTANWKASSVFKTLRQQRPIIIAHRGASGYLPEHTLAAYTLAAEMGADFIEPDLVSTKDGVLIARHEPFLSQTTDIADHPEFAQYRRDETIDGQTYNDWFACDLTLVQIKTLRACQSRANRPQDSNGLFEIPTLTEILNWREKMSKQLARPIGVYLETKHPTWHRQCGLALEDGLLGALRRFGLNDALAPVFVQSFELTNLRQIRAVSPIRLIYLIDGELGLDGQVKASRPYDFVQNGDPRSYADMLTDDGLSEIAKTVQGIGSWKMYLAPHSHDGSGDLVRMPATDLVKRAHKVGLLVHVFTFRNETEFLTVTDGFNPMNEYSAFFDQGVDGVFSDFSDTAVEALTQWMSYKKTRSV